MVCWFFRDLLRFAREKRSKQDFSRYFRTRRGSSRILAEGTSCKILETRPSYQVFVASERPTKHEKLMHLKKTFVISVAQKGAKCLAAAVNFSFLRSWSLELEDCLIQAERSEAWWFMGSRSWSLRLIGCNMAEPIWLKLAGLVRGNSVTVLG